MSLPLITLLNWGLRKISERELQHKQWVGVEATRNVQYLEGCVWPVGTAASGKMHLLRGSYGGPETRIKLRKWFTLSSCLQEKQNDGQTDGLTWAEFSCCHAGLLARGSHRNLHLDWPSPPLRPGMATPPVWYLPRPGKQALHTRRGHKLPVSLETPKHGKHFFRRAQFSEQRSQIISMNGKTMWPLPQR